MGERGTGEFEKIGQGLSFVQGAEGRWVSEDLLAKEEVTGVQEHFVGAED